jgi:hypothetical protein
VTIGHALVEAASYPRPETFENLCEHIPSAWIEEALEATGTATLRRRRLPVEQVIWLVLGIALFRDRRIEQVVDSLDLALPSPHGVVAKSAISAARARLGDEPMKWLFERSARKWAHESAARDRWRGLALYGIDGTGVLLPDSEENRREFGVWTGRGEGSNPLVRLVVLVALRSHLLAAASFASYRDTSELHHATAVVDHVPPQSLTILDALYMGAAFLLGIEKRGDGRHWMTPAKKNTRMRVLTQYSATDALVEMDVSDEARQKDPSLPRTWRARAITCHRKTGSTRTLLTSLLDPVAYPEEELRSLYHERWEVELAYDELKTELLEREITLRSKLPGGVRQELWGILLGFNLVRLEMERIAAEAKVAPRRISFTTALQLIRDEWQWQAATRAPGAIPKQLASLRAKIKRFILPDRRSHRSYPREIKNDYRRYPRRKVGRGLK